MIINRLTAPLILIVVGLGLLAYNTLKGAGFMNSTSRVLRRARASHAGHLAASR
jgi:hypothetical protein